MRTCGFTLLELLAVLVLLTLAITAAAVGLARAGATAQTRAVAAGMLDLDRRARLTARGGVIVEMVVSEDAVLLVSLSQGVRFAELPVPAGLSVQIFRAEERSDSASILFDFVGCSPDYSLTVAAASGQLSYSVAGVTGWSRPESEARR